MKRPWRIVVFAFLATGAFVLAAILLSSREPVYEGKRLSAWLSNLGEGTPEKRMAAGQAIRQIGTNAAPAIAKLLQYKDSTLKRKLRRLAAKQSLVKFEFENESSRRQRAFIACDALGPAAAPLVPKLLNMLTNESPPEPQIPYLLARIGPSAAPALSCALTNNERAIRLGAKQCLELLRTNSVFLNPENGPLEDRDYLRRSCQYNLMILQAAFQEYRNRNGMNPFDRPPSSLPDDFDPKSFEPVLSRMAKQVAN